MQTAPSEEHSYLILTESPSAAGTIRRTIPNGKARPKVLALHDALPWGPLAALDDMASFCERRAQFWAPFYQGMTEAFRSNPSDLFEEIEDLLLTASKSEHVEVWLGESVADQVFAAFLAELGRLNRLDLTSFSIRQFATAEDWPALGYQNDEFFVSLPERAPFSLVSKTYQQVWAAIADEKPHALTKLLQTGTGLEVLDLALASFFERFPSANSGLGSIDRGILAHCPKEWVKAARIVGPAMADGMPPRDRIGDLLIFRHLVALSVGPSPCVETRGDVSETRGCEARLTEFGNQCLLGNRSRIRNGLDEWVGGVHLDTRAGNVWVRDGLEIAPE